MLAWVSFNSKIYVLKKIDNKSDWCSRESLTKNYLYIVCGIYVVPGIGLQHATRLAARNAKLLFTCSFIMMMNHWSTGKKYFRSLLLFFTIGSYRSMLNCLFCSLAGWQKGIYFLRGLEDTANWKALENVIEICCRP